MEIISLQGPNNREITDTLEKYGIELINAEVFTSKPNGHKFQIGDRCQIHGMEMYVEFNGEIVTISAIRQNGKHGRAYYFTSDNSDLKDLNWTYEYRLKAIAKAEGGP